MNPKSRSAHKVEHVIRVPGEFFTKVTIGWVGGNSSPAMLILDLLAGHFDIHQIKDVFLVCLLNNRDFPREL
jgi:hypothetical protein